MATTSFDIDRVRTRYQRAVDGLKANICPMMGFEKPVLLEGSGYTGIWLECGPLEGLHYARFDPVIARNNHEIFFHLQREDGYLPFAVWRKQMGSGQIQMVVSIVATALELAERTHDERLLEQAYHAGTRWDDWLVRHRNTRSTGLVEAFCEYDTGHDNSPRFHGLPKDCPNQDASVCPNVGGLPYLAPDLSATVYGQRVALAKIAEHLNLAADARRWVERAEQIREAILRHCFDPEDECFYDVDREGKFVKVRGDLLTRVCSEHVPDQALFERIYQRYIRNPNEFWTPYPLPSVSVSDPQFVSQIPVNSWGGATQALTALRTLRWFDHYGKSEDHRELMRRWVEALTRADMFAQQLNPWTGDPVGNDGYSPAMLVYVEFVDRLGLLNHAELDPAVG